jgi:hypothetical protein
MSSYRTWYDPPRKGDEEPFPGSPDDMMDTVAALRAQNAELVAALEEARKFVVYERQYKGIQHARELGELLERIDDALTAAGHKP